MTDTTLTLRPQHFARRLWLWLTMNSRRRKTAAHLHALTDRELRDIGIKRDRIDDFSIKTAHDSMRYSG